MLRFILLNRDLIFDNNSFMFQIQKEFKETSSKDNRPVAYNTVTTKTFMLQTLKIRWIKTCLFILWR